MLCFLVETECSRRRQIFGSADKTNERRWSGEKWKWFFSPKCNKKRHSISM